LIELIAAGGRLDRRVLRRRGRGLTRFSLSFIGFGDQQFFLFDELERDQILHFLALTF
jgi:hypothetical protein